MGSIRRGMLAVPVLALVAAGAAGCTIESGTNEGKISTTAGIYLRALARATTPRLRPAHGLRPGAGLRADDQGRTSWLDPAALNRAADHSLGIDVHGNTATARLSEPGGARFALVKLGARWRIDSGYTSRSSRTATGRS
jgi:hypothetical protein